MTPTTLRARLHRQLEPDAWEGQGLSPLNRWVVVLIVLASLFAVFETEAIYQDRLVSVFLAAEAAFVSVFALEYLLRLYAAGEDPRYRGFRGRLRYMVSWWSLIDLLAIAPSLIAFGTDNAFLVRLLKLLRLLRLSRLGRFSQAIDALAQALVIRRYELVVSCGIAGLLLVLSSALLYVAEAGVQPEAFGSIPRALWWSVATLTTVGYGDVAPVTAIGRIFAALTAIAGIGMIAMPTGILASAFSDVVRQQQAARDVERS